jgi:hypothetical protein
MQTNMSAPFLSCCTANPPCILRAQPCRSGAVETRENEEQVILVQFTGTGKQGARIYVSGFVHCIAPNCDIIAESLNSGRNKSHCRATSF